ncbi:hypothetical protein CYY_001266 [Polysphondylium violaceum]|uniref:Protein-serine/threonine phosphatase n=1 Tax=Polysphondylium violaceum TaxID=133409 RepID=A0A8J4V832_9MYCE|nr:hypothetical protein CYY_001266 [Polysphondylium violaceum]
MFFRESSIIDSTANDEIDSMALFNLLQEFPNNKVIIDCRDTESFSKGHIRLAINTPPPGSSPIDYSLFDIDKYIKENYEASFWNTAHRKVIVYSDKALSLNTDIIDTWEKCVLQYFISNKKKTNVLYTFTGDFESFQREYPFMVAKFKITPELYPSEVIKDFLYLGGETAQCLNKLKSLKITHIVNMASEVQDSYTHLYKYYRADVDDRVSANIDEHFQPIIKFIEEAKQSNGRVLVHCQVGISRSASVVIAYLMKTMDTPYFDTYKFVKSKRCIIQPNPGFVRRLKAFDEELTKERKKKLNT